MSATSMKHYEISPRSAVFLTSVTHWGDQLYFEIFDHDNVGKDTALGHSAVGQGPDLLKIIGHWIQLVPLWMLIASWDCWGWEELQDDSGVLKETLILEESGKKVGSGQPQSKITKWEIPSWGIPQDKQAATVDVKITVVKRKLEVAHSAVWDSRADFHHVGTWELKSYVCACSGLHVHVILDEPFCFHLLQHNIFLPQFELMYCAAKRKARGLKQDKTGRLDLLDLNAFFKHCDRAMPCR